MQYRRGVPPQLRKNVILETVCVVRFYVVFPSIAEVGLSPSACPGTTTVSSGFGNELCAGPGFGTAAARVSSRPGAPRLSPRGLARPLAHPACSGTSFSEALTGPSTNQQISVPYCMHSCYFMLFSLCKAVELVWKMSPVLQGAVTAESVRVFAQRRPQLQV